ncbi:MAG: bifunctional folylpolyglutamate synthase/dihydrofolate synthase [Phycisphaeraceae bacterium]|nr:bifunctional folylpolyglutamate synthase/dihydrofolate synthase [Phycisphaeraceae bacterium]
MPERSTTVSRPAGRKPVKVDAAKGSRGDVPPGLAPGEDAPASYQQSLKYLADLTDFERVRQSTLTPEMFKLDRMRALLEALGNPQQHVKFVHVAGTKGKGSTCEMTAAGLEACGYAVGVYTSPHLVDIRERIRINRRLIPHAEFAGALSRVREAAKSIEAAHGTATFFEHLTAMALLYFFEQAVDIAVIEVGLGGRLDSTNVIRPEVTAITTIGLDHTQLLGSTVEAIAREKAGIFKSGVTAITAIQKPEVLAVLAEAAQAAGAPLRVVGADVEFSVRFDAKSPAGPRARVCLSTPRSSYEHIAVPLRGEHQAHNCGVALAILDALTESGFKCPENRVIAGLEKVELSGRFEVVPGSPRLLLDGAHNEDSIRCLVRAASSHLSFDSMITIFGCCADKDTGALLRELAAGADKVIFTRASGNPRAADPRDLARKYAEIAGRVVQIARSLEEAMAMARKCAGRGDVICVTGSMYLVGEAKRLLATEARRGA